MKLTSKDILLFSGDSITHGNRGLCMDCNHIFGHGYQYTVASRLALDYCEEMPRFVNKAYSGYTMKMLMEKWNEDVIENKPTIVSLLCGTNDAHQGYLKGYTLQQTADDYAKNLNESIDRTRESNPDVKFIILEPFYFPLDRTYTDYRYTPHPNCEGYFKRPDEDEPNEQIAYRNEAMKLIRAKAREIAEAKCDVFVPLADKFEEAFTKAKTEYFIWDGTHPTIAGHELIAREWFKGFEKLK